jgi:hypothetical protein
MVFSAKRRTEEKTAPGKAKAGTEAFKTPTRQF